MSERKEFDLEKFLDNALGAHGDCFSFGDIQEFARAKDRDSNPKFSALKTHLESCERCNTIRLTIVECDPFLSQGKEIPNGFWEEIWEKVKIK